MVGIIFARLNVDAMLPTFDEVIESWRPDLVVRESAEFASAIAAERHGVRHVRVAVSDSFVEHGALGMAAPAIDERHAGRLGTHRRVSVPQLLPGVGRPRAVRRDAASSSGGRGGASTRFPTGGPASTDRSCTSASAPSPRPSRPLRRSTGERSRPSPISRCACCSRPVATRSTWATCRQRPRRAVGRRAGRPRPRRCGRRPRWGGDDLSALAAGCPLVGVPLFGDQPMNVASVAAAYAGVVGAARRHPTRRSSWSRGRAVRARPPGALLTRCAPPHPSTSFLDSLAGTPRLASGRECRGRSGPRSACSPACAWSPASPSTSTRPRRRLLILASAMLFVPGVLLTFVWMRIRVGPPP